jgi:hypothetical protein
MFVNIQNGVLIYRRRDFIRLLIFNKLAALARLFFGVGSTPAESGDYVTCVRRRQNPARKKFNSFRAAGGPAGKLQN